MSILRPLGPPRSAPASPCDTEPARPGHRRATWPCVLVLVALVAAMACTFTSGGTLGHQAPLRPWYVADIVLFALAVLLLRHVPAHRTAALVLAGSLAIALTGLLVPPRTGDDAYRYLWDGQVQSAGISPYTYAPTAPALAGLRASDPALFPVTGDCTGWDLRQAGGICTHIDRPTAHTVYPPVAFLLCYTPYVIASGLGILGYLPGYLQEQGHVQGTALGLVTLLDLPQRMLPYAVAAVLLAAVLYVLCMGDPHARWRGVLLVAGTGLFLAVPGYPWYALPVVALVAMGGRWEWLAVPVTSEVMYLFGGSLQRPAYAAVLCLALVGAAVRVPGRVAQ